MGNTDVAARRRRHFNILTSTACWLSNANANTTMKRRLKDNMMALFIPELYNDRGFKYALLVPMMLGLSLNSNQSEWPGRGCVFALRGPVQTTMRANQLAKERNLLPKISTAQTTAHCPFSRRQVRSTYLSSIFSVHLM